MLPAVLSAADDSDPLEDQLHRRNSERLSLHAHDDEPPIRPESFDTSPQTNWCDWLPAFQKRFQAPMWGYLHLVARFLVELVRILDDVGFIDLLCPILGFDFFDRFGAPSLRDTNLRMSAG
jgi:hypothetical protein